MNKSQLRVIALFIMLLVLAAAVAPAGADPDGNAVIRMDFAKSNPDADLMWNGAVSGDVNGDLVTQLLNYPPRVSDGVWHVEFDWHVDGDYTFTARLKGILDTKTGRVTMNGPIIAGDWLGAQVHEQGQLVDAATSTFVGTIQIMPGSAD